MIKTLLPYIKLYTNYPGWILLGLLLAIVTIFSGIGLLTLSGWFLASSAIAGIVVFSTFNYLLPAAFVRGLAISRTAFRYFERIVSHEATFRLLSKLRVSVFKMIFPRQYALTQKHRQADILNRLITDVETLDSLYLRVISPFISSFVVILLMTFVLSFFNLYLSLFLGSTLFFVLCLFPPVFYKKSNTIGEHSVFLKSSYRDEFNRFLTGQTLYIIYEKWQNQVDKLAMIEYKIMRNEKRLAFNQQLSSALILIVSGLSVCLMIYFVGLWTQEKNLTELFKTVVLDTLSQEETYTNQVVFPAMAALFVFATLAAFEMLIPVSHAFVHLGAVIASANRLNEIENSDVLVNFPNKSHKDSGITKTSSKQPVLLLENVSFTYPDEQESVMKEISFQIFAQQKIAIIGHTGSGKSTLFYLLTRAYEQQQGKVQLFDAPIESYSENELRQLMSLTPQTIYLFSESLRENLLLAQNSALCSVTHEQNNTNLDEKLKGVLDEVGLGYLHKDGGLDQLMGDGGRALSGGELRRIGIARALIHDAPLWLFDEPTEGLDSVTEQQILELIFRVAKNKTLLMITHRISSLSKFDKIYTVENGHWIVKENA